MTPDEFALWQFENQLLMAVIRKVEAAEYEILDQVGMDCGRGHRVPELVEAKLSSRSWREAHALAPRDVRRAVHAMHVLVRLRKLQHHLGPGQENARLAAHEALLAGLFAGDAARNGIELPAALADASDIIGKERAAKEQALNSVASLEAEVEVERAAKGKAVAEVEWRRSGPVRGGQRRGAKISEDARAHDESLLKALDRWRQSEYLQFRWNENHISYLSDATRLKKKRVYERLKALGLDVPRQRPGPKPRKRV